jgi:hypothetical protein
MINGDLHYCRRAPSSILASEPCSCVLHGQFSEITAHFFQALPGSVNQAMLFWIQRLCKKCEKKSHLKFSLFPMLYLISINHSRIVNLFLLTWLELRFKTKIGKFTEIAFLLPYVFFSSLPLYFGTFQWCVKPMYMYTHCTCICNTHTHALIFVSMWRHCSRVLRHPAVKRCFKNAPI